MCDPIFVGLKRPGNFGPVSSFTRFSHTYWTLVLPISSCSQSYIERLIDFLTGLLYYEDVYTINFRKARRKRLCKREKTRPVNEIFLGQEIKLY